MDLRPPLSAPMDAFSVPAVVTLEYQNPVTTRGIWVTPEADATPFGAELQRKELKRVMAFSIAKIPALPIGTKVVAPEFDGEASKTWKVDALDSADDEFKHVVLVEVDC